MFCSSPAGMLPDVTGPYCSQTRSGAAPPEAWVCTWALLTVMEEELFGSQSTVTFLWAASYSSVSCLRPAFSAELIAPVLGGSTALIVTGALLGPPGELAAPAELDEPEPPDEQAAARMPATARAAAVDTVVLRGAMGTSPPGER